MKSTGLLKSFLGAMLLLVQLHGLNWTENRRPSIEEYRKKVVEFMKHFEHTLSDNYPNNAQKEQLIEYVKKGLQLQRWCHLPEATV